MFSWHWNWKPEDYLVLAAFAVLALCIVGYTIVESIRAWRRDPPETDHNEIPPVIEKRIPPKIAEPKSGNG